MNTLRKGKLLAFLLAAVMVLALVPMPALAATDITSQITDANLLAAIRDNLGKSASDPITDEEMLTITTLDVGGRSITSIAGLQYAQNLQYLHLTNNSISDLSPLSGITSLSWLWAGTNNISDISVLSTLTGLTNVDLGENNISDISPLAGLTGLVDLHLQLNDGISDISDLEALTNLQFLDLGGNAVSDLSTLAGMTGLITLGIAENNVSDISVLSPMTGLTYFNAGNNQIDDISVLADKNNLVNLSIFTNQIEDITPLAGLTNLTFLDLWQNQIDDISVLSGLTGLEYLYVNENNLSDISAVSGLTNLKDLYVNTNVIRNLPPLSGLVNLERLSMRNNNISDISALEDLVTNAPNLEVLYLRHNYLNLTEGSETKEIIDYIVANVTDAARWDEQNALSGTPFDAQATVQGTGSIALSWDDMPDTVYEVSRSAGTDPAVDIPLPGDTDTAYTDTGLSASTEYTYLIKAHIWVGDSVEPVTVQKTVSATTAASSGSGGGPGIGYTYQTVTDSSTGITVSGAIPAGAVLTITDLELGSSAACDAMRQRMNDDAYAFLLGKNISLSQGFTGSLTVSLPVGAQYNGQTVTILHCKDGKLETYTATVQDGKATFTVTGLSPFAVFLSGGQVGIPQTGSSGFPVWLGLLAAGALIGALFLSLRRRSKSISGIG